MILHFIRRRRAASTSSGSGTISIRPSISPSGTVASRVVRADRQRVPVQRLRLRIDRNQRKRAERRIHLPQCNAAAEEPLIHPGDPVGQQKFDPAAPVQRLALDGGQKRRGVGEVGKSRKKQGKKPGPCGVGTIAEAGRGLENPFRRLPRNPRIAGQRPRDRGRTHSRRAGKLCHADSLHLLGSFPEKRATGNCNAVLLFFNFFSMKILQKSIRPGKSGTET